MLKGLVRVLFQGKNLLWTNLGISVGLSGFGDVITQAIEGKNSHRSENKPRSLELPVCEFRVHQFLFDLSFDET